jgi:hypothetical protein
MDCKGRRVKAFSDRRRRSAIAGLPPYGSEKILRFGSHMRSHTATFANIGGSVARFLWSRHIEEEQ